MLLLVHVLILLLFSSAKRLRGHEEPRTRTIRRAVAPEDFRTGMATWETREGGEGGLLRVFCALFVGPFM